MTGSKLVPAVEIVPGLLSGLTLLLSIISPFVNLFTRPNERSTVDYPCASIWISSFDGSSLYFLDRLKINGPRFLELSYFTLALIRLPSSVKKRSGGSASDLFSPSKEIQEINVQKEFNFHNIYLTKVFSLSEDHLLCRTSENE